MEKFKYQVAIVGGGPVGFGAAIDLAQRGIKTVVIEKHHSPQPVPKGQNLTQRTLEHFRAWQAEDELRAARKVPAKYGIGGVIVYDRLMGDYYYDWLQRSLVGKYYATRNERLPQYATEAVLRARAAQLDNLDILYGYEADGIRQTDSKAVVSGFSRSDQSKIEVEADYVIGADGSRSVTRESAGITRSVFDHNHLMILLVFNSQKLNKLLERYPGKSFYCVLNPKLKGYWLFFGREDLDGNFFFHAPLPEGATPDDFDFESYIHQAVGEKVDIKVKHKGYWDCRVAIANSYRSGRVFIAGDSAHNHPPYGGYGINSGFEDARNLSWKLALVLKGLASEKLLDSYDEERRPVFWSTAKDFIEKAIEVDKEFLSTYSPDKDKSAFEAAWQARSSGAASEVDRYQPNYRGSSIVFGNSEAESDAVAPHSFKAQSGFHLAPRSCDSGVNIYDQLSAGFSLIAVGAPADEVSFFESAAENIGLDLKVIRTTAASEAADYNARYILVRPDHFVAWAGSSVNDESEVEKILRKTLGLKTESVISEKAHL